VTSTHEET
jgi:uncharacterized membrane protein